MLSKNALADRIAATGAGGRQQVKAVLDGLTEVALEELNKGEKFTIPGVARLEWKYTAPRKKGEMYGVGDTVKSPQGERIADAPSPARKQSIKLRAYLVTATHKIRKDPSANRKAIAKAKK